MCGIAGFVSRATNGDAGREGDVVALRRMCDAIRHRGPDDAGYYVAATPPESAGARAAIGMRRLSIIDVAGGHQPMTNEDGTVHVVFNGEIYNYQQLRSRLLAGRHQLTTHSDTETLVHLYEDLGADLARELRGMFAFAIWDARRGRLLVARDRLGIKPLYYWRDRGWRRLRLGAPCARHTSGLSARGRPRRRRGLHGTRVRRRIRECIFTGVRKLPPGHLLEWSR